MKDEDDKPDPPSASAVDVWTRPEPESPCIRLCSIHPVTRLCLGCNRTLDEIAGWSRMTPEARRDVMSALPDRRAAPEGRRGGRARRLKG